MSKCLLLLLCNVKDLSICLRQSSIQITFDNSLQFAAASRIDGVTCTDQSAHRTVKLERKKRDARVHHSLWLCCPKNKDVFYLSRSSSHIPCHQVLHCRCWVDTVTFPVTVTQQSPAAVSMDTYQITTAPTVAKVPRHTWIFCICLGSH